MGIPSKPIPIMLGEFSPDLSPNTPNVLVDMNWVWSTRGGWRVMEYPVATTAVLPSVCAGAFQYPVGSAFNQVLATFNQLYVRAGSGSLVSQGLTLSNTKNPWSFTVYGNDLIAVNGVDADYVSTSGAGFVPLSGNPPIFSVIAASDYALFGLVPNSQQFWFTLNDQVWIASIANETANALLTSTPGNLVTALGLRAGINIYKNRSFFNGQFVGPPTFFQFSKVAAQIGVLGQNAVVTAGPESAELHYFAGSDFNFYVTDGFSFQAIPNPLQRYFQTTIDPNFASTIQAGWDALHQQVIWLFASVNPNPTGALIITSSPAPGTLDTYLSYNLLTQKWGKGTLTADYLLGGSFNTSPGYVDANHTLQFLSDGTTTPAAAGPAPFVQTSNLGDHYNIYRLTRVRPHFVRSYPLATVQQPVLQVWSKYTGAPHTQMTQVPFNNANGFFDLVMANRDMQLRLMMTPALELSEHGFDVEMAYAGRN